VHGNVQSGGRPLLYDWRQNFLIKCENFCYDFCFWQFVSKKVNDLYSAKVSKRESVWLCISIELLILLSVAKTILIHCFVVLSCYLEVVPKCLSHGIVYVDVILRHETYRCFFAILKEHWHRWGRLLPLSVRSVIQYWLQLGSKHTPCCTLTLYPWSCSLSWYLVEGWGTGDDSCLMGFHGSSKPFSCFTVYRLCVYVIGLL